MTAYARPEHTGVKATGTVLAAQTCLRRLDAAGVRARGRHEPGRPGVMTILAEPLAAVSGRGVDCEISSFGPVRGLPNELGGEAVVQAMSGLMAVHGSDNDVPIPVGLDVASVAAGIVATHGVLAGLVGQSRGVPVHAVRTSLLQAALLVVSHYVAAATGTENPWPKAPAAAPGPPFRSADGVWFEIETLDPAAWRSFWGQLGVPDAVLGTAWTRFRARYFSGRCTLPADLHEATLRHRLAEIAALAASYRVSLAPVRSYPEVLADLNGWRGTPSVEPLPVGLAQPARPGGSAPGGSPGQLPLAGLLVVEATTRMQGPLAGLLLAMLGADVVKVEPPGGDIGRGMPPLAGELGTFFRTFNRGKRTIELDLATPVGRAELVDLVTTADVFLHNWRPGRDATWSLRPADLARANSALIYAQASGWGARPELDRMLGTDFLVQAYAGLGYGLRPPDEPPRTSRVTLTDCVGALVTCEGILTGLLQRCGDGRGRQVGTSLLAGGMSLQAHVLDGLCCGTEVGRHQGRPLRRRLDQPITTVDGAVLVDVNDEGGLPRAARACGLRADRDADELEALVVAELSAVPARTAASQLRAAELACAVVRTDLAALPHDPDLAGLFEPLGGTSEAAAAPWAFGA